MKVVYRFNAYPPGNNDDEPNYSMGIYIEADTQHQAKEFLKRRGFTGIEEDGHIRVYNGRKD